MQSIITVFSDSVLLKKNLSFYILKILRLALSEVIGVRAITKGPET